MSAQPDEEPIDIAIPVLPSLDIAQSMAFYGALGFDKQNRFGDYAIVRREAMEIHFWLCDDRRLCESSGIYLRVSDVEALFARMAPNVVPPARVSAAVELRPWGMREFNIWDPHGNLLRIGQIDETAETAYDGVDDGAD